MKIKMNESVEIEMKERNIHYFFTLSFRNLPPQFPQDKPCITVQPAVRHPWVDVNSKVSNCPNINNVCNIFLFNDSHSFVAI